MTRKKLNLSYIIIGLFFISSCSQTDIQPVDSVNFGIIPLSNDYYWKYEHYEHFSSQPELFTSGETTLSIYDKYSLDVNGTEMKCYRTNFILLSMIIPNTTWLLENFNDGLYLLGSTDQDSPIINELILKYPVEIGDSWQIDIQEITGLWQQLFTCIDTTATLQALNKTFFCYVFEYVYEYNGGDTFDKRTVDEYYVPNLGLIGVKQYSHDYYTDEKTLAFSSLLVETNVPIP
ncbi:MAG: hypothetical protein KKA84_10050 [Bacteroidetes bacterium]|nr:hypothetical protein [Bacteroidota bacterium]